MTPIATVLSVSGNVFVRNQDGELRALKPGDILKEGELVVAQDGGDIELKLADGGNLSISEVSEILLSSDILYQGLDLPESPLGYGFEKQLADTQAVLLYADENAIEADEIDALLQALENGQDLNELIEAPAAGESAQEGGHSFVRLGRIFETLPSIDTASDLPATQQIEVLNPAAAEGIGAGALVVSLSLSATESVIEGDSIIYTATLNTPAINDVSVTLDDGSIILIPAGSLSGSITVAAPSDAVVGEQLVSRQVIQTTSEGGTNPQIGSGSVTTTVIDDNVPTNLTLSVSGPALEGGSLQLTATLDNPAPQDIQVLIDVPGGAVITIAAGQLRGDNGVLQLSPFFFRQRHQGHFIDLNSLISQLRRVK